MSWFSNLVRSAGRAISSAAHAVDRTIGKIETAIKHVPVFGSVLYGMFDFAISGPFKLTNSIVEGQRLDRAFLNHFKSELADFKAVGPYAQMILSFVPGFGTVISAAIGAALAIANGQPITEILLAGIKGAVPGGPLAQMAFNVGQAALKGGLKNLSKGLKGLEELGLAALPIPDIAKEGIRLGLELTEKIAKGERVASALLDEGMAAITHLPIPDVARQGLSAAADVVRGLIKHERIDKILIDEALHKLGPKLMSLAAPYVESISKDAIYFATANPAVSGIIHTVEATAKQVASAVHRAEDLEKALAKQIADHTNLHLPDIHMRQALNIGVAMGHAQILQSLSKIAVVKTSFQDNLAAEGQQVAKTDPMIGHARSLAGAGIRGFDIGAGAVHHEVGLHDMMVLHDSLSPADKQGFELAGSLHIGRVTNPPAENMSVAAAAGHFITHGLAGATSAQKAGVVAKVAAHPESKAGMANATLQIQALKQQAIVSQAQANAMKTHVENSKPKTLENAHVSHGFFAWIASLFHSKANA